MLVFIAGFVMLACSANLLVVYFAWELIGLCSYFLVGFWYKQQVAADGARKVLIITHIAGYGCSRPSCFVYVTNRQLRLDRPDGRAGLFRRRRRLLMIVAAMAKSVMYPLHTWIPEAMNAPTPVSALLHSACYVKAGVYLIARMYSIAARGTRRLAMLLLVIGCVDHAGRRHFRPGADRPQAAAGVPHHQPARLYHDGTGYRHEVSASPPGCSTAASHALFKGTLFMCAGAVQHATGTRDMRKLGGLAGRMPVTTLIWLVAAAAIVGVPLTNGFVAKWLLFDAALEAKQAVVVVIAWAVSILTAFSFLKATVGRLLRHPEPRTRRRGHP